MLEDVGLMEGLGHILPARQFGSSEYREVRMKLRIECKAKCGANDEPVTKKRLLVQLSYRIAQFYERNLSTPFARKTETFDLETF